MYDLTRNQIGLVPSVYTNPYNDEGIFTSSKMENTHKKNDYIQIERTINTWLSFAGLFITFFIRNVIIHHTSFVRDAFDEDGSTPKRRVNFWGYENVLPPAPDAYE